MASVSLSYQDVLGDPEVQGGAQSKAGTAPGAAQPQPYERGVSSDGRQECFDQD